jgi:hypothetical protein
VVWLLAGDWVAQLRERDPRVDRIPGKFGCKGPDKRKPRERPVDPGALEKAGEDLGEVVCVVLDPLEGVEGWAIGDDVAVEDRPPGTLQRRRREGGVVGIARDEEVLFVECGSNLTGS